MCVARGMSRELHVEMFAEMSRQSERQLGAFMLEYAIEFGEAYRLSKTPLKEIVEFRNPVIHKGTIPTVAEAHEFARRVYSAIVTLFRRLRDQHATSLIAVTMQDLKEKQAKVPPGMPIATNTGTMFFSSARANIEPDFAAALDAFRKARQLISDSIPYMRALQSQPGPTT